MTEGNRRTVDPALQQVAGEFDLGEPLQHDALTGGGPHTVLLCTTRDVVVVKDGGDERELHLYKRVEETLNAHGVRQARLYTTASGQLRASTGQAVFEFVPGKWAWQPTPVQAAAFMRYFAAYNTALRAVPVPPFVSEVRTPWKKADSLDYVLQDLPGDLAQLRVSPLFTRTTDSVLTFLSKHRPILDAMPKQLVHGDVGPGNILYADEDGVVLIDFTPYRESPLYSLCVSFYWHYVYGNGGQPDLKRIGDDLRAYAAAYPFSIEEKHAFYPIFVKAAARILFVPILLTLASGQREDKANDDSRAAAMANIMAHRKELEAAIADT